LYKLSPNGVQPISSYFTFVRGLFDAVWAKLRTCQWPLPRPVVWSCAANARPFVHFSTGIFRLPAV